MTHTTKESKSNKKIEKTCCACGCKIHNKRKPRDPNKPKRPLSEYNKFVKEHYHKVRDKPIKERLKLLSVMWRKQKKK